MPKAKHNGGTHISPTVPWDGLQSSIAAYLTGAGETDPTGSGCWVRDFQGKVNLTWFGTRGDGVTDDAASITAFRNYLVSLPKKRKGYIPAGVYSYSAGPNWSVKGIHLVGDGKNNTVLKCTAAQKVRTPVTVGGSPFTYNNESGGFEYVLIVGGNVTQILFKRDTDSSVTGTTSGLIMLAPGDQLVISYSTLPVISRIPMGENYT
ncbi:glycoside hydrolase family 55 protein [Yersinia kristensenii]|uniref:glycoside hydrolase family 55 protein n=1 Tax=Yersinia kristensenii TaxID=28152 RepID=UPI001D1122C8|nr:glycoside hydrolase family 55 protein [Yersinia kristensenii]